MRISRQSATLCVVVSLLAVVASCVDSKNPLSDEKSSKIDERLIGVWRLATEDRDWKVVKSKDVKNALEVTVPGAKKPDPMFTTTIKSNCYVSVWDHEANAKRKADTGAYSMYQYVFIDKDTVEIRHMSPEVIAKAIAAKQIRGEIVDKEPVITDTTAGIAQYVEGHADECFPKTKAEDERIIFKRQK
jgi:hypothetical protein